jgi:hypothetical protein
MLDIIAKLETPETCQAVEKNAIREGRHDLATAARKRALELRARAYNASNEVERKCLEAIYAYEQVLSAKNRKKTYASRTWPMVKRYGIIGAVERAVNRKTETAGYTALLEMGLGDYAFEAVILEHPNFFSEEAVKRSQERVSDRMGKQAKA